MLTVDFARIEKRLPGGLAGARILDIGCGPGRHACAAGAYPGAVVAAADIGRSDLVETRLRFEAHRQYVPCGGSVHPVAADIRRLPFPDAGFDLVICSEVLEHIADEAAALAELNRVTRAGGLIAVTVPRYLPERICWALSDAYHAEPGGHIRIYRTGRLKTLLRSAGLILRGGHWAHALHAPFWWLRCAVGPHRADHWLVALYHRLLVWDMMEKPRITRWLERLLNPVMGKSVVIYCEKARRGPRPDAAFLLRRRPGPGI